MKKPFCIWLYLLNFGDKCNHLRLFCSPNCLLEIMETIMRISIVNLSWSGK